MSESEQNQAPEEKPLTKSEILSAMRQHQQEYAKFAAQLKVLSAKEEHQARVTRQFNRLETFRNKYKFFVDINDGSTKEIDWNEIEKLIKSTLDEADGYGLGFDQTGMPGLGASYHGGGGFQPMVEEESDGRKVAEYEARRREYAERAKKK